MIPNDADIIEQAARVIWHTETQDLGGYTERDAREVAQALAAAGLLAVPAPNRDADVTEQAAEELRAWAIIDEAEVVADHDDDWLDRTILPSHMIDGRVLRVEGRPETIVARLAAAGLLAVPAPDRDTLVALHNEINLALISQAGMGLHIRDLMERARDALDALTLAVPAPDRDTTTEWGVRRSPGGEVCRHDTYDQARSCSESGSSADEPVVRREVTAWRSVDE